MTSNPRAKALIQAIGDERARGVRIRRGLTLAILAVFLIFGLGLWRKAKHFDTNKLTAYLEKQGATTIWPLVSAELTDVAHQAVPALEAAFGDEVGRLGEALVQKLGSESEVLQKNLDTKMRASLDAHFKSVAAQHKAELGQKLPEFAKDDAAYLDLMGRLETGAEGWAQHQLDTTFARHIRVLQSINESMQSLQAQANEQRKKHGEASAEDVMMQFLQILNERVVGKDH